VSRRERATLQGAPRFEVLGLGRTDGQQGDRLVCTDAAGAAQRAARDMLGRRGYSLVRVWIDGMYAGEVVSADGSLPAAPRPKRRFARV
jgi:hypothetical protein